MADALQAGAAALQDLIRRIGDMGDSDLLAASEDGDNAEDDRDYRAMAAAVQDSLHANLEHPSPDHRQGYLRALTHVLSLIADGAGPSTGWDPIKNTAAAYVRPAGGRHV